MRHYDFFHHLFKVWKFVRLKFWNFRNFGISQFRNFSFFLVTFSFFIFRFSFFVFCFLFAFSAFPNSQIELSIFVNVRQCGLLLIYVLKLCSSISPTQHYNHHCHEGKLNMSNSTVHYTLVDTVYWSSVHSAAAECRMQSAFCNFRISNFEFRTLEIRSEFGVCVSE